MWRKRVLRVVLVVVGLIFIAGVYPLVTSVRDGWRANKEVCFAKIPAGKPFPEIVAN